MKTSLLTLTLTRIGDAQAVCLPAGMIRRHGLEKGIILEERGEEIVLRAGDSAQKLTWEETYREMAAAGEDWSEWDAALGDGLNETNEWSGTSPAAKTKTRRPRG